MSPVARDAYRRTLDEELARLSALPVDHLDDPVPSCPRWDVAALVAHLGRIHRWVTASLATPEAGDAPAFPARPTEQGAALMAWFAAGADAMVDALGAAEPDARHPTWAGVQTSDWWLRRQVFEHAVHRWDAQHALGVEIDPLPHAADGIDEWFEVRRLSGWSPPEGLRGSIHLHGTDGEGEWLVELDGSMTVTHGHRKGDAAVRGALSDLLVWLWGRSGTERLEVLGDDALVARFLGE